MQANMNSNNQAKGLLAFSEGDQDSIETSALSSTIDGPSVDEHQEQILLLQRQEERICRIFPKRAWNKANENG